MLESWFPDVVSGQKTYQLWRVVTRQKRSKVNKDIPNKRIGAECELGSHRPLPASRRLRLLQCSIPES